VASVPVIHGAAAHDERLRAVHLLRAPSSRAWHRGLLIAHHQRFSAQRLNDTGFQE